MRTRWNYEARSFLASVTILVAMAIAAPRAGALLQPSSVESPVVAIVARSGLLLPLATFRDSTWTYLPWPSRQLGAPLEEFPLPVRRSLADIPSAWFQPLSALPRAWSHQAIGGSARDVTIGVPMRMEGVLTESVGLTVRPWNDHGNDTDDAGIAVAGKARPLPVRHLYSNSREWQMVVDSLTPAFLTAEARSRGRQTRRPLPSLTVLKRQLRKAEVTLAEVRVDAALSYWHFETFVIRPADRRDSDSGCSGPFAVHHGLLEHRAGARLRVRWLRAAEFSCGSLTEGGTVVGAVRVGNRIWVVAKWSGDDWADYHLVDPLGPGDQFAPGPIPR